MPTRPVHPAPVRRARPGAGSPWLVLVQQLPASPSNARVKTWRRLQQLGAVALRNSVYVLPNSPETREDFEWLKGEIGALKGSATVFEADCIGAASRDDLIATFQDARDADYRQLVRAVRRALQAAGRSGSRKPARRAALERETRRFRERLSDIQKIDYFRADSRAEAEEAVAALERRLQPGAPEPITLGPRLARADYHGRRWLTRPRPGIDRCASAWLILRFIDAGAMFCFGEPGRDAPDAVPFDTFGAEFSHQGDLCTFEVLVRRFGIGDPGVDAIGRVVHDLDLKDDRYGHPDTATIGRLVAGLQRVHADDHRLLAAGVAAFDALHASLSVPGGARGRGAPPRRRKRPPR